VTLQPAKPNKPLNNPSYEFYTMLDKQEPLPTYQPPVKPKSKVIPPTAKKVQQATKPSGKYIIQIQSFNSKKSAQGLRGVLILQNYKDVFIQEVSLKNQTWYRVNMGPFQSKQQARSVQKSLQQYATMIKTIKS
ncbi:MAG: SPOR domain-containing protein, partial [Methylococcales bacterium]|nr:SPOR domain-containing protein [Methylococcales bacterium]